MAWISQVAHFWILEHTDDHFLCWLLNFGLFVVDDLFPVHRTNLCPPDSPKFCQLWLCVSECLSVEKDEKKCIFTGTGVLKSVALEWWFLMSWLVMDNLMIHWYWNINFHSCIMKFVFVVLNQSFNVYYAVFHFWCLVFASGRQISLLHLVHLFVHYFHVFIML